MSDNLENLENSTISTGSHSISSYSPHRTTQSVSFNTTPDNMTVFLQYELSEVQKEQEEEDSRRKEQERKDGKMYHQETCQCRTSPTSRPAPKKRGSVE